MSRAAAVCVRPFFLRNSAIFIRSTYLIFDIPTSLYSNESVCSQSANRGYIRRTVNQKSTGPFPVNSRTIFVNNVYIVVSYFSETKICTQKYSDKFTIVPSQTTGKFLLLFNSF